MDKREHRFSSLAMSVPSTNPGMTQNSIFKVKMKYLGRQGWAGRVVSINHMGGVRHERAKYEKKQEVTVGS